MNPQAANSTGICPICSAPTARLDDSGRPPRFRPFCSARCQKIDLGNWLGERYVVPDTSSPAHGAVADSVADSVARAESGESDDGDDGF